jgi:transcriptional regulator with GAF, ATPase, and Fis domain
VAGTEEDGVSAGLADILSSVARLLQAEPDVETTIGAIVKAAMDHIPGVEHAGVTLITQGELATVAPTSDLVVEIDRIQYSTNEGPCVDAIAEHETFRTGNLAAEQRWHRFASAAAEAGVLSMLSYRLFVTEKTMGALNLYSSQGDAFSATAENDGQLFASHAAVALVGAQHEAELYKAVESRDVIGMAKGILMQRHDIDEARAFHLLAQTSQQSNMKVRDIAAWLVRNRREI